MKKLIVFCMIMSLVSLSFGQNVDGDTGNIGTPQIYNGPVWTPPGRAEVLYDNGPLATCNGCGSGGADVSILQNTSLGMNLLGWGHQVANNNSVADDFVVDDDWHIDTITFFAYQTGEIDTIEDVRLQIYDGEPGAGGSVIWGDLVTNVLSSATFSNIYRVAEDAPLTTTNRPIMAATATVDTDLGPGTYWLEWQVGGSGTSGPWAPPITVLGQTTTGNGLQAIAGAWQDALDSGTNTQQGFPFIIEGSPACEITSMYLNGNDLNIYGACASGVDIYYTNGNGTTLVASGVSVDGSTTYTLSSVAPDAVYYVTAAGGVDILAETGRTVPTLGEWGLILFVMLLAGSGVVFMRKRRMA